MFHKRKDAKLILNRKAEMKRKSSLETHYPQYLAKTGESVLKK